MPAKLHFRLTLEMVHSLYRRRREHISICSALYESAGIYPWHLDLRIPSLLLEVAGSQRPAPVTRVHGIYYDV
jgi:hypothetical protein